MIKPIKKEKKVLSFSDVDINHNELIELIKQMESNNLTDEQMKQLCNKSKSIILKEYE